MRITAKPTLVPKAALDDIQIHNTGYLTRAIRIANAHVPGGLGIANLFAPNPQQEMVGTWFGDLDAAQVQVLVTGLRNLQRACADYVVQGKPHQRHIEWCSLAGHQMHNRNLFAQAYAVNVANFNSHFTVRIYSGLGLAQTRRDWMLNTFYHELTHRIINTDDVALLNGDVAYGEVNVRALTQENPANALNNASNWAYYITACNGRTDWGF